MLFARVTMIIVLLLALGACSEKKTTNACAEDCPEGWTCNEQTGQCEEVSLPDGDTDTADTDKTLPDNKTDTDNGVDVETVIPEEDEELTDDLEVPDIEGMICAPGAQEKCTYTGAAGTEDVGPCKAGKRTCKQDGSGWTSCSGEVVPLFDTCNDQVDQDCNGTPDDLDQDGDGVTECGGVDCCYTTDGEDGCPVPEQVYPGAPEIPNGLDDNCNDQIDEGLYDCDASLSPSSTDPMDYAKAIGLCATATEGGTEWGVISAQFLLPDGTGAPHAQSHAIFDSFGSVIVPKNGVMMAMLTTGFAAEPFDNNPKAGMQGTPPATTAPTDWLTANGGQFPASPACGTATTTSSVKDSVMLKLRVRTPAAAKSFSFNLYFFSQEYVKWVCDVYNDFFLTLLDSGYTAPLDHPEYANPADKNLAMDSAGNPVGVNLAPAGLFKQCVNGTSDAGTVITTCQGTAELQGTGFETVYTDNTYNPPRTYGPYGGTGWLTTRGNVEGGEIIELRFVIWDTNDQIYNSAVIIDNFEWQYEAFEPGTGPS